MIVKSVRTAIAGARLYDIRPDAPLREACCLMDAADIGALAVMEGDALLGIVTERDVIRRALARRRPVDQTPVAEIMTPDPQVIGIDAPMSEVLETMKSGGFRHMPVTEAGRVVGMISIRDIPTEYRLMHERFTEYRTTVEA